MNMLDCWSRSRNRGGGREREYGGVVEESMLDALSRRILKMCRRFSEKCGFHGPAMEAIFSGYISIFVGVLDTGISLSTGEEEGSKSLLSITIMSLAELTGSALVLYRWKFMDSASNTSSSEGSSGTLIGGDDESRDSSSGSSTTISTRSNSISSSSNSISSWGGDGGVESPLGDKGPDTAAAAAAAAAAATAGGGGGGGASRDPSQPHPTRSTKARDHEREVLLSGFIAFMMLVLGTGLLKTSLTSLSQGENVSSVGGGLAVATLGAFASFFLYFWKNGVGERLQSMVVIMDAKCSRCVGLISVVVIMALLFEEILWWADGVVGVGLSIFILWEAFTSLRAAQLEWDVKPTNDEGLRLVPFLNEKLLAAEDKRRRPAPGMGSHPSLKQEGEGARTRGFARRSSDSPAGPHPFNEEETI